MRCRFIRPRFVLLRRSYSSRFAIPEPSEYLSKSGVVASLEELVKLKSEGKVKKFQLDDQVGQMG